jgi:hypothetical protein
MATKKPKATKVTKKAVKAAVIGETALARVYKVKKQFDGGVRAEFCKAIPAGGAPLSAIAKKAGVDIKKALGYARWLAANDYLTRVEIKGV